MDALKEVKEWLFNKFQTISANSAGETSNFRGITALTPKNIPEFVIPGSEHSSRRTSSECCSELDFGMKRNSYGGRSYASSPPGSPRCLSPSESAPCIHSLKNNHCRSAPVTPKHEIKQIVGCREIHSTSGLDHVPDGTNDDPLSFAAISLPHFRVKTSYGFTTLSENPHTRRKESLFHAGNDNLLPKRYSPKAFRQNSLNKINVERSSPDLKVLSRSASCITTHGSYCRSMPSVVVTAARQNSRTRTPSPDIENVGDLTNRRLSPSYHLYTNDGGARSPLHSKQNRYYNRRRSSLVIMNENGGDSSSPSVSGGSTPSCGSHEHLDDNQRRSLGDLNVPPPASPTFKRHSAPNIPLGDKQKINESSKPRSSSCHVILKSKPNNQHYLFAPFGELKFSFQYLAASKQFKVTIIKAENLGGHQKQDKNVNAYAKLCLMPGKIQKQTTAVIKKTRNPVFEQDMYFHHISLEELHSMALAIKLFSKSVNFKSHEFIGEVYIPLDNYDVMVENRIWKDLESHKDREDLGFLSIGLKFNPGLGILTVNTEQARQLPLHPITGAPNPYVRVEVTQPYRSVIKHQTSVHKNEANPSFEQSFSFDVSPHADDMYATSVNVLVYDHDRFRSDVLIGQVVLGCLATEVGQYGHWQEMLENPNLMISKWHYLIDLDD
ncbi:synaptotagmin-4-like [Mercenaria mercenaria]|uniref:synaptotagmin-4-like n=1 Tax=Mercenaria mercenaria TaxID=6596 RepID=UPI00234F4077|nr:synaptotagmin-4-like [Mercenaria mercenaria]